MPELADLFPGFASEWLDTDAGRIFARVGGKGPPLLLLHGYPQTHAMWHQVAPALAERFTLVVADLPGYGQSDVPPSDAQHTPYTKRAMAQVMAQAMERLGFPRFAMAAHDRGARVGYRLALDQPQRLTRLALLDILPTYDYWLKMDRDFALRIYHWTFLAQPHPLPERLIEASADAYFMETFRRWTKPGRDPFDPRAVAHYLAALRDPARIHAACEDYRAGAHADFEHDRADVEAGRTIEVPLLVLWGSSGVAAGAGTPLDVWRRWATQVRGGPVESGHFLCEENPAATVAELQAFLAQA
ncbi:alpha/beta fold hydrolase [Ramlibacter rhizophilus]|uniref:Alpha/beta hydrolase n=1 Tax=Ramlibacter rhizophilus TaxID=1781167 RepID=A0A4Z0BVY8_9BURK|nr:alpha/beta hydrolase [Ramlibacter rhizophilus]TFZ03486.1 alpha/beta hydrolase [Ramlibacter rhizophilus]